MHVNKTPGDIARLDAIQKTQSATTVPSPAAGRRHHRPHRAQSRGDQVQISDEGRALAECVH